MRLINTKTLELEEFPGSNHPPYGVLSHTWGDSEVSFQDMSAIVTSAKQKAGFNKIRGVCQQAQRDGLGYVWVDTACIDKASPAELNEAVNSIFTWFQFATICYVYLADLSPSPDTEKLLNFRGPFYQCRWFTRGWTLLELIAPPVVRFFDCEWNFIGTKKGLVQQVSQITGIPESCLIGSTVLEEYSIAERMSWAAQRRTTRIEDMAYSLMGLFEVKMPAIYGEGKKTFIRLQEEIMKQTTDQSILAWSPGERQLHSRGLSPCPILAENPAYFLTKQTNRLMKDLRSGNVKHHRTTRTKTSIVIWAPVIDTLSDHLVFAVLNCDTATKVWMPLWKTERQSYHRVAFPIMTLYSTGMLTGPRIAPTQLCLEGPVSFADTATESNSSNPLESDISLTVEQPEQETEAAIEVLVAFLDGKELVSKSAPYLYPPIPPNEDNRLGTLRLCHGGHGYYHGILAFEIDRKNENKTIAVFFAASMRDEVLCAWTCRVLLNLNDASSTNLERVSASELAKICSDEQVPSTRPSLFESPIWRRRDQNGKTVVELVEYAQVIIAEVVFNVSTQNGNLLSSLQAAFEKNKKEQT